MGAASLRESEDKKGITCDTGLKGITCEMSLSYLLGFVEELNNKIRVIQRRAYGLRNEEYLRLKFLTCMLPVL
jgi:hypothetical protein